MIAACRKLWAGDVPLAEAFWFYAVLLGTLLNLLATFAAMALLTLDASGILISVLLVVTIPYNVFVAIAVWRSAGAYAGPRHYRDLARIAVVLWALVLSLT